MRRRINKLSLGGTPVCDIAVYRIRYTTVGGANEATDASAALMVPTGTDARCRGPRPIVLYAHATTTDRTFDIAKVQDSQNTEGVLLAAFFASRRHRRRAELRRLRQLDASVSSLLGRDQQSKR